MSFSQQIKDCIEHPSCTVIVCVTDARINLSDGRVGAAGSQIWESHWDAATHPEHRINRDYLAYDYRTGHNGELTAWTKPCQKCIDKPDSLFKSN
jgi:hypothetical protein